MTVKEWLNRGYRIDTEINSLLEEQSKVFLKARGTVTNTYSERINNRIDELYSIKQEILTAISQVQDPVLRALLTERYIKFNTWEKIAHNMHYSYVHIVHTLHPKALKKIGEVIPLLNMT